MTELEQMENNFIAASVIIGAIYEMAERADATSISGIAACHTLLNSLKKNRGRVDTLIMQKAREIVEKRESK